MSPILRKKPTDDKSPATPLPASESSSSAAEPDSGDFATLLETHLRVDTSLKPGDKVVATVVATGDEWVFLDFGGKSEGVVSRAELLDEEGKLTVREGDRLEVFFLTLRNNVYRFTTRIGGAEASTADLEEAYQNEIPVEGLVAAHQRGFAAVISHRHDQLCQFLEIFRQHALLVRCQFVGGNRRRKKNQQRRESKPAWMVS